MSTTNEQPNPNWSDWKKPQTIVQLCGIGLVWYQKYLQSLILLNFVLTLISLIPIGVHIYTGSTSFEDSLLAAEGLTSNQSSQLASSSSNAFASVIFILTTASYQPSTFPYVYAYMGLFFAGISSIFCCTDASCTSNTFRAKAHVLPVTISITKTPHTRLKHRLTASSCRWICGNRVPTTLPKNRLKSDYRIPRVLPTRCSILRDSPFCRLKRISRSCRVKPRSNKSWSMPIVGPGLKPNATACRLCASFSSCRHMACVCGRCKRIYTPTLIKRRV